MPPSLPVTVHETMYLQTPVPAAVSRVTLHVWCDNRHPDTPTTARTMPLALCMQDAFSWVSAEAPDFYHGMLIHAVQKYQDEPAVPPTISTFRQYATRYTTLGNVHLPAPAGFAGLDTPEHVVLVDLGSRNLVPRWVWYGLATALLHTPAMVGEAPPAAGMPERRAAPGNISASLSGVPRTSPVSLAPGRNAGPEKGMPALFALREDLARQDARRKK